MTRTIEVDQGCLFAIDDLRFHPGKPQPFGANPTPSGVQFSVFSRHATAVWLLLFDSEADQEPRYEVRLSPECNKTGDCWHVAVEGISAGQLYLYRMDGPFEPSAGHRFNKHKVLLDPYAKALSGGFRWDLREAFAYIPGHPDQDLSFSEAGDSGNMPKCVVVDDEFDWQGDRPLNYPLRNVVIYETHVRGLTAHPSAASRYGVQHPGTFRGVTEMIPYLKDLGITSLELLPVQEFDEFEYEERTNPHTGEALKNYWGYSTIAFFAPKASYAHSDELGRQVNEFKEMIRQLHAAGIEVILDIVFNHSGEGDQMGHTFSFRGIDNRIYYMLAPERRYYMNYSGCGNTLNCNHPVVRGMIIDALRYWVQEMHIDGFRFDLGSILGRDENGELMDNPPVLERIAEDPLLRDTKIIAEAWDAGGAYQVGNFPGGRWAEWNDRYRDDIRSFWKGDWHKVSDFATRFGGSADLYLQTGRKPFHSINYITAHDGFTMNDLVSYNEKHNEANGEENRDGHNHNLSFNYGAEGPSDDGEINATRNRMVKNMLATLLLSSGTPMMLGGDEIRRTQGGNNNAYCHDNEISWYDYGNMDLHADIYRFARMLIAFRKNHPALQRQEFFVGRDISQNQVLDISWFNEFGEGMDWGRNLNIIALRIDGSQKEIHADQDDTDLLMLFNATGDNVEFFVIQPKPGQRWYRVVDTGLDSPHDVVPDEEGVRVQELTSYLVRSRSLVLMISR
jgi:isoamylase